MSKLDPLIQLLAVAFVVLLGHPESALAELQFSPLNPVTLNIGGPGQTSTAATITVTSTGTTVESLSISNVVTSDGTNWLCALATSNNTIGVSAGSGCRSSTSQLAINTTYTGQFRVTAKGKQTGVVLVTLNVGSSGATTNALTTIPNQLTFTQSSVGQPVGSQTATAYSNGAVTNIESVTFTPVSGPGGAVAFVSCLPSGSVVTCSLNGSATDQGTYTGTASLTTAGSGSISLPITLTLGGGLTVSPNPVNLSASTSGVPVQTQLANLSYNGQSVTPTSVSYTTLTGGSWLQASLSGSQISVAGSSAGLGSGTYTGTVTANTASYGVISFQVLLNVGGSACTTACLSTTPNPVNLYAGSTGAVVTPVTVRVLYNGAQVTPTSVTYTINNSGSWLQAYANGSGITVNGFSSGLAKGTYSGTVTVSTPYGVTTFVVDLNVGGGAGAGLTASPNPVTLVSSPTGGVVQSQIVSILYNGSPASITGVSTTTSTGQSWLRASSLGTTVNVTANTGNLAAGVYTGTVTVNTTVGATSFQVNLTAGSVPGTSGALAVSPSSLQPFIFQIGGSNPVARVISAFVASPLGLPTDAALSFSASATTSSGGSWLSVTPTTGTTLGTVSVTVNPSSLVAGTYSGMITISVPGTSNSPVSLPVSLTVTALVTGPTLAAVQNAASSTVLTSLSPGLNVVIYGANLGPATLAGLQLNSDGAAATSVAGTQVTFSGNPAPILYTKSTQVSVMVPYEVLGSATTSLVVSYNGMSSTPAELTVVDTAPGIYTLEQSGTGQGLILNQNGTLNGPQNPEIAGNIIQIYLTGEGQTSPAGVDGAITSGRLPTPTPTASVQVMIGGVPVSSSNIGFYGEAPGAISGIMRVDAQVPPGAGTGAVPVIVTMGGHNSQANVTISLVESPRTP